MLGVPGGHRSDGSCVRSMNDRLPGDVRARSSSWPGELNSSKPSAGTPSFAASAPGIDRARRSVSSRSSIRTSRSAPAANAYAANENARRTSTTTATPSRSLHSSFDTNRKSTDARLADCPTCPAGGRCRRPPAVRTGVCDHGAVAQATSAVRRFWSLAVADATGDRHVIDIERVEGGNYARAWLITVDGPPQALVGRRLPAGALTPVAAVNRLLERCTRAGVPTPTPVWARGTPGVGVQSQLLTWIDGSTTPPDQAVEVSVLADAVMRIPTVDSAGLALPDFPQLPSPRWQARIRRHTAGRAALERLLSLPRPALEGGLVHGDLCKANLVWRDAQLVAIIDWDRASRGPTAVDIAMLWTDLVIRHGLAVAERFLGHLDSEDSRLHGLHYWQLRMIASSFGGETGADVEARLAAGYAHITD